MKSRIVSLTLLVSIFLFACSKSSYNNSSGGTIDQGGDWHITLFSDSGKDEIGLYHRDIIWLTLTNTRAKAAAVRQRIETLHNLVA